jgi:hypothetical protein
MTREYEIFERFPDGSSLWRASHIGLEKTQFQMRQLADKSEHQFYAIDVMSGKVIRANFERGSVDLLASQKHVRRSKSATA